MIVESIIIFVLLLIILGLVYQFMYGSFLIVLIVAIVFFLGFLSIEIYLMIRKKEKEAHKEGVEAVVEEEIKKVEEKPEAKEKPAEKKEVAAGGTDELAGIKAFIKQNLQQGFKEDVIKSALKKQGWTDDKINKAYAETSK